MCQKGTRHDLGPLDLYRCKNTDNIYEKYSRQVKEGVVRKEVAQFVKEIKSRDSSELLAYPFRTVRSVNNSVG
jgi:hypothetical protein